MVVNYSFQETSGFSFASIEVSTIIQSQHLSRPKWKLLLNFIYYKNLNIFFINSHIYVLFINTFSLYFNNLYLFINILFSNY